MHLLPATKDLLGPLLEVLREGNVQSNDEIRDKVATLLALSPEQLRLIHSGNRTELEYRLAWARTQAKRAGLIESPHRMHWRITQEGKSKS